MKTNNGSLPAMPFIEESKAEQYNGSTYTVATCMSTGLSKREMFAMAAMQGLCAAHASNGVWSHDCHDVSDAAVKYADALLAELEKSNG